MRECKHYIYNKGVSSIFGWSDKLQLQVIEYLQSFSRPHSLISLAGFKGPARVAHEGE